MFILVMGVAGSGKTTIGALLAAQLGWPFYDADDFHSGANISKMVAGIPLDDEDRIPWLEELRSLIANGTAAGENGVLACSALKSDYRMVLSSGGDIATVYLKADAALIRQRMEERRAHYMPTSLVESQFQILEEPEDAIVVPAAWPPERIVSAVRSAFGLSQTFGGGYTGSSVL
jgi:gluconokinase